METYHSSNEIKKLTIIMKHPNIGWLEFRIFSKDEEDAQKIVAKQFSETLKNVNFSKLMGTFVKMRIKYSEKVDMLIIWILFCFQILHFIV